MLFAILFGFFLTGCVDSRLQRNLESGAEVQKDEFIGLAGKLANERISPIGWKSAWARMEADNLSFRQSRQQLADTEKQTKRQWLSLVPSLSSYISIGSSLSELSNLSSDDINAHLVSNLHIPNPFEFHATLYALALQKQNAIWSHELDRRRAYVQLYAVFLEENQIKEAEDELAAKHKALSTASLDGIDKTLQTLKTEELNLERRRAYHRLSLNQLLNTPGANWKPEGGLPRISYRKTYRGITLGERFGKLALNLQTVQIEGALLRRYRVKFQQWPSVNFGVSAPPLYSSNHGSSFSSDDLRFFSGVSKAFDLTDIGGRESLHDADIRLAFTREQLRSRMESEILRIEEGKKSYGMLLEEEKRLMQQMKRFEKNDSSEIKAVSDDIKTREEMTSNLASVRRRLQQLDLQFLVWDEQYWKN